MIDDRPIRVLGIGNVLMSDDGLGPYVARLLDATYELPGHVEVIDAGTPGLDFTPFLAGARAIVVVDTVTSDGPPGKIRRYDMAQLLSTPPPARINPHQPGLEKSLVMRRSCPSRASRAGGQPGIGGRTPWRESRFPICR